MNLTNNRRHFIDESSATVFSLLFRVISVQVINKMMLCHVKKSEMKNKTVNRSVTLLRYFWQLWEIRLPRNYAASGGHTCAIVSAGKRT